MKESVTKIGGLRTHARASMRLRAHACVTREADYTMSGPASDSGCRSKRRTVREGGNV